MQHTDTGDYLYEALSYIWGSPYKNYSIRLDKCVFHVTKNLYAALSRLRNRDFERIIWIDAICINQDDLEEREHQIRYMAKIYSMAKSVIVWFGESAEGSDLAFEAIGRAAQTRLSKPLLTRELCNDVLREVSLAAKKSPPKLKDTGYFRNDVLKAMGIAAKKSPAKPSLNTELRNNVLRLIERPWFRRVWVLQEVAAARHILIMCGAVQLDGYTFCLGLQQLNLPDKGFAESQALIRSVVFLISQAIFRPKSTSWWSGRTTLEISPLAELIDMYHDHEATVRHDKIFALLGMSTDDLTGSGLLIDYNIPWVKLFESLLLFVSGKSLSVEVICDSDIAVAKATGYVMGEVSSVELDISWSDRQQVEVTFWNNFIPSEDRYSWNNSVPSRDRAILAFLVSANPIQEGDLVCVLKHNPTPVIVRPRDDFFEIVKFNAVPYDSGVERDWDTDVDNSSIENDYEKWVEALKSITSVTLDFLLVWQWNATVQQQEYKEVEAKCGIQKVSSSKAERLSKVALVMAGSERFELISQKIQDAIDFCKLSVGKDHPNTLTCMDALGLLCKNNGNWKKAEAVLSGVIQTRILVQGENHSDTLNCMQIFGDLATALEKAGLRNDAKRIAFILQVLKDQERTIVDEDGVIFVANTLDEKAMAFLLRTRGHEFKVTEGILKAAISNSHGGEKVTYLLLEKRKEDIEITEEIFQNAVENFYGTSVIQHLLEERGGEFKITEQIIEAAAGHRNSGVLQMILQHLGDEFKITDNILKLAAYNENPGAMKLLFQHANDETEITEETIKIAAYNRTPEVMQLILQHPSGKVKITDEIIEIAASHPRPAMMKLLLDYQGKEITIPEAAVKAAAKNWNLKVMERILQHPREKFKITEETVEVFARAKPIGMMELLLQYRGREVKVSETVVKKAMSETDGSWVLERLHEDQGKEIAITEAILNAVSQNAEIMRILVDSRGDELRITPQILRAVAEGSSGDKTMRLLLQEKGHDFIVTEDLVEAAVRNYYCGKEIFKLLLDFRGVEVKVSEKVVKNAASNPFHGEEIIKLLLERRRDEVTVTKEVVITAATAGIMLVLIDRLEDSGSIPDEILNSIPENWDTREKIMRDITIERRYRQKRLRKEELQKKGLPDDYDPEAQYDL